jgi:hypothetical protein
MLAARVAARDALATLPHRRLRQAGKGLCAGSFVLMLAAS